MRHLGNVLCTDETKAGWIDVEEGDNLLSYPVACGLPITCVPLATS